MLRYNNCENRRKQSRQKYQIKFYRFFGCIECILEQILLISFDFWKAKPIKTNNIVLHHHRQIQILWKHVCGGLFVAALYYLEKLLHQSKYFVNGFQTKSIDRQSQMHKLCSRVHVSNVG